MLCLIHKTEVIMELKLAIQTNIQVAESDQPMPVELVANSFCAMPGCLHAQSMSVGHQQCWGPH